MSQAFDARDRFGKDRMIVTTMWCRLGIPRLPPLETLRERLGP